MIQRVLTGPVYAGVFAYGRRQREVSPGDPPAVAERRRPPEAWGIVVPGGPARRTSPATSTSPTGGTRSLYNFVRKGRGAPREGLTPLQGFVVCGRCGRRMSRRPRGGRYHRYGCRHR